MRPLREIGRSWGRGSREGGPIGWNIISRRGVPIGVVRSAPSRTVSGGKPSDYFMNSGMSVETKDEIRRRALLIRNELSIEERTAASLVICRRLIELDLFLDARGVHVYLPFGSEVDIRPLINLSWDMGKDVGLMRVQEDGGNMQYRIHPTTEYRKTKLGILEPVDTEPFNMELCDLVIAPVVAADAECNRLGYGRGYYDQFLTQYPRPAVGVAFEAQMFDRLPADELDIKLDAIFTERRVISPAARG